MSTKWQIVILLALGLLTRFIFFGSPNETVFDEVHFGKFISGYYTHEYFFDIHPPLGKLIIAGFVRLFNFRPEFTFAEIGDKFPDKQYMILRFLPSLAGALLPLIIYLLLLEFGLSSFSAFAGGIFIVLENALLAQSRFILMDSFLLLVGFLALLFYFKYTKYQIQNTRYLLLFGLFAGLASSIKWTGLSFLALPLVIESVKILKNRNFKPALTVLIPPVIIAGMIYFAFFALHLTILNKSGPGDAFMSKSFQKTLAGSQYESDPTVRKSNIFQKFNGLNSEIYKANQRLTADHPYSSQWYTWPFMTRPIYYWVDNHSRVYLLGNPVIWWLSTAAVLYLLLIYSKIFDNKIVLILLSGYFLNLLPFIGVKRVMFLYHYFSALIFAILMLVYAIDQEKHAKKIFTGIILAALATFIYFAPLNYGLELSPKAYEARVWLESWR